MAKTGGGRGGGKGKLVGGGFSWIIEIIPCLCERENKDVARLQLVTSYYYSYKNGCLIPPDVGWIESAYGVTYCT